MNNRVQLADGKPARITDAGPWKDRLGLEFIVTREQAFELLDRARGKTPADWLSWTHLGVCLQIAGETEKGLAAARRALAMHCNSLTLLNVAVILESLGRFDEAFELSSKAIKLDPEDQFAGLLWAQGLLRQGRWKEGWKPFEWYSWGTMWEDDLGKLIPKWEGASLFGKRILVIQNGGFGDNMMFMRWLKNLKQMGAHVTYACPDVMVPVLENHPWIDRLMPTREGYEGSDTPDLPEFDLYVVKDNEPQFDYFIPMMGLALRFNARVETMKWSGPYIQANPEKVKLRRYVLNAPNRAFKKVGICWMGAERLDPRRHRSLDVEQTSRLLRYTGVDWICLQYGMNPPVGGEHIFNPQMKDWSDTAAIIECCDLVVTVDTGVMHLAGAMQKPCFVILPGLSDWKFLLGRDDSPFYPSLRLFRNQGEGLDNALDQVIEALKKGIT